jgi:orotate phosphoribosyltransferase
MALFYYGIFREAEARFANGHVTLHHVTTWRQVLDVARAQTLFDKDKLASVQSFLDDPLAWSAAHGGVSVLSTT